MKSIHLSVLLALSLVACDDSPPSSEDGSTSTGSADATSGDSGETSPVETTGGAETGMPESTGATTGEPEGSTSSDSTSGSTGETSAESSSTGEPEPGTLPAFGRFFLWSTVDATGGEPRGGSSGTFFSEFTVPDGACDPFDGDCGIEDGCTLVSIFGAGGGEPPPEPEFEGTEVGPSFLFVHDGTTELEIERRDSDNAYFSREDDAAAFLPGDYGLRFGDEAFDGVVEVGEPPAVTSLSGGELMLVPGAALEITWTPGAAERVRLRVDAWGTGDVPLGFPGDIIQLTCYGDDDGSLTIPAELTAMFSPDVPKGLSAPIGWLSRESWGVADDGERQLIVRASGETTFAVSVAD